LFYVFIVIWLKINAAKLRNLFRKQAFSFNKLAKKGNISMIYGTQSRIFLHSFSFFEKIRRRVGLLERIS